MAGREKKDIFLKRDAGELQSQMKKMDARRMTMLFGCPS